ncbi:Leucine rich repeat-containing protein [Pseudobutyrivibrio sp. YE44]|uniref:leucine-rich repeat domain-containing protein n=1 Tax=Pseudobutyrivibrio sp. YE44 TaxID=1520802 RepID=UPI00088C81D1|nr:leucine-rich repeat domain-containing protein [Pseudobutyrivibrio sp. YE44]SDB57008.1 Leucine rich repeat-containing protein [Pseudobutyrivibrio sp. YE44]
MQVKKKPIILVLMVTLFVILILAYVNNNSFWVGDYKYLFHVFKPESRVGIVEYRGGENVEIPDKLGILDIDYISREVFDENSDIKKITIKNNNVDLIEFFHCVNLETVVIGEGVENCYYDFSVCTNLHNINICDGVKSIDFWLDDCENIESLDIPDTVQNIQLHCDGCKKLKSVNLPVSIDRIHSMVFSDCTSLEEVKFPKTVKEIDLLILWGTPFEEKHKNDKYYVAGDGCLIFNYANPGVVPNGVKNSCNEVGQDDHYIYYPDSLKIFDYSDVDYNTHCFGAEEFEKINIDSKCTIIAPEGSPMAKYCQENGLNYRPSTPEEEATRKQKTEAAASEITYQDNN